MRAANNARDKALLRISANDLLQEWLGRLPDGDVTIGYAPEALGMLIRSQEEPGDLADLSDRDLVRLVTLGVQDNFLLVRPQFTFRRARRLVQTWASVKQRSAPTEGHTSMAVQFLK